jgi:hypothetical protein
VPFHLAGSTISYGAPLMEPVQATSLQLLKLTFVFESRVLDVVVDPHAATSKPSVRARGMSRRVEEVMA